MSTIARIVDGIAVDIRVTPEFTPPNGETWVECPPWVQPRSRYSGGLWSKEDGAEYLPEETRHKISPLTLLDRLTHPELKAVVAMAIGVSSDSVTDAQESAWRLMLSLGATGEIYSNGRAAAALPNLFGAPRAAELLAPDPSFQPS